MLHSMYVLQILATPYPQPFSRLSCSLIILLRTSKSRTVVSWVLKDHVLVLQVLYGLAKTLLGLGVAGKKMVCLGQLGESSSWYLGILIIIAIVSSKIRYAIVVVGIWDSILLILSQMTTQRLLGTNDCLRFNSESCKM